MTEISMVFHHLRATFDSDFGEDLNAVTKHLVILDSEATLAHRRVMHTFVLRSSLPDSRNTEPVIQQDLKQVSDPR